MDQLKGTNCTHQQDGEGSGRGSNQRKFSLGAKKIHLGEKESHRRRLHQKPPPQLERQLQQKN